MKKNMKMKTWLYFSDIVYKEALKTCGGKTIEFGIKRNSNTIQYIYALLLNCTPET